MRYICALLEADILGHLTFRLRMKVSRWYSSSAIHIHNRAEQALPYVNRYRFNRYNIHLHFAFITKNVPNIARRHLC
ncbi:hypothetical protein [Xenorhabdus griffiniae]|uniref:hypothetical protein n=1 Tax=Xenorhabdus griffiniae TaxID=351672 RepID=UPI00235A432A|nr:hypothetical protein [Xenorhabdus griffiniae]MDC9606698.1 hypothetical protein [Xenorhabdus griffiniae]